MSPITFIRKNVLQLTQSGLAQLTGTSQATVSRWEAGELFPDHGQMTAIRAEALRRGSDWNDAWFFDVPEAAE